MEILHRKVLGIEKDWKIYTKEEADKEGIKYVPWKEADKPGWVLSDDGYVGELIRVKPYNGWTEKVYSFGKSKYSEGDLNYEVRKQKRAFSTIKEKTWDEIEAGKQRTKDFVTLYTGYLLAGRKPDLVALGSALRPDQANPVRVAKSMLKVARIKKMIQDELLAVLGKLNIDDTYIGTQYKKALEIAEEKKDPKAMREIIDKLAEYRGWDEKVSVNAREEYDFTRIAENGEQKGKRIMEASAERKGLPGPSE